MFYSVFILVFQDACWYCSHGQLWYEQPEHNSWHVRNSIFLRWYDSVFDWRHWICRQFNTGKTNQVTAIHSNRSIRHTTHHCLIVFKLLIVNYLLILRVHCTIFIKYIQIYNDNVVNTTVNLFNAIELNTLYVVY